MTPGEAAPPVGEGALPAPAGRRLVPAALAVLVVAAALLRLWYLPHSERMHSETPAVRNVEAALAGGETRDHRISAVAWYPQLVLLRLADRRYDRVGGESWHVATAGNRVTQRGLQLARLPSVLWGAAALPLLFLVARRLHSPGVALLAALILAFSPWHIQASVAFTPDVQVLTLSLLALWLGMRALDRPTPSRFALVGVALGAAAAAKLTGLLIAPPVIAGLVLGGRREARRLLLAVAVTLPLAVAVCWALTPPWGLYAPALEIEQASQTRRAAREMSSRFTVAVFALLHPLRESVHGRLLGSLALLGAAGQAFRCLFLVDPGPARAHRLMVLAAMPVFALGYAWATPLYQASSFVPLLGYSALYAAVMLGILWQSLTELAPRLRTRPGFAAAAAVALALAVPAGWSYVHASAVRSTLSVAVDWLRRELGGTWPRIVLFEEAALEGSGRSAMQLARGLGLAGVGRLAGLGAERLAGADAEIFLHRELVGPDAELYRSRRGAGLHRLFEARLLERRGPDLVAVLHPREGGPPEEGRVPLRLEGRWREGVLPAAGDGVTSQALLLRLPATPETAPEPPRAWLDDVELALAAGGLFARETLFVSERLPAAPRPRRLRLAPPGWMAARRGEIEVACFSWR